MKTKPKFNKKKCLKCKYRGTKGIGYPVRNEDGEVVRPYCNYSAYANTTCLKPGPHGTSIDSRGNDYNNCKLFVEGDINDSGEQ